MARPIFDTQADIPKGFEDEYVEKDGKWHPKPADELGDRGKEALEKERKLKKEQKDRADALEKERDDLKRAADAHERGITKEALQEIRDKEAQARKPLEDENTQLKAKLRKVTLTDRLEGRLLKAGAKPDRVKKALKDLEGRVDLTDDGEDFVVKDEKGNVTSETLDNFLSKTYKEEAPFFYSGVNSSGSGAEESAGGGGSGYDPVKAGKDAAAAQKKATSDSSLAFK